MKAAACTPYLFQFGVAEGWGQKTPDILPSIITKTKDAVKHWLGNQVRLLSQKKTWFSLSQRLLKTRTWKDCLWMNGIAPLSYNEKGSNRSKHEAKYGWGWRKLLFCCMQNRRSWACKSPKLVQSSFLRVFWFCRLFLVFSCYCQFSFLEPGLLSSLSKVTSKRTCQHSLSVWHECQCTVCGCWWGTRFLVTAGMSDCYMHFKSLQKICWWESKSQSLLCL